jgi:hypothetical protein
MKKKIILIVLISLSLFGLFYFFKNQQNNIARFNEMEEFLVRSTGTEKNDQAYVEKTLADFGGPQIGVEVLKLRFRLEQIRKSPLAIPPTSELNLIRNRLFSLKQEVSSDQQLANDFKLFLGPKIDQMISLTFGIQSSNGPGPSPAMSR